jgi:putative Mg2+ transporter-C (MgtC) family protein
MSLNELLLIEPFHWRSIGTAVLCGIIIGLERQLRGKPVGIRTSALITLGTYIFLTTANVVSNEHSDPSRVIGQVVTGIGFLGAGVMLARDGAVVGVTSAATIWVLAAIGVVIAIDSNLAAIKLALVTVFILYGMEFLEAHTKTFSRGVHARYKDLSSKSNGPPNL